MTQTMSDNDEFEVVDDFEAGAVEEEDKAVIVTGLS